MTEARCSTRIQTYLCCRDCWGFSFHCGHCGHHYAFQVERPRPLPLAYPLECEGCGAAIRVELTFWRLNPTGEGPPPPELLSDVLPGLRRCLRKPAARPTHRWQPRQLHQQPCPPEAERHRLAHWVAQGLVSAAIPPASVARGYRLAFGGQEPPREPGRPSKAYSRRELELALQALGVIAAEPDR